MAAEASSGVSKHRLEQECGPSSVKLLPRIGVSAAHETLEHSTDIHSFDVPSSRIGFRGHSLRMSSGDKQVSTPQQSNLQFADADLVQCNAELIAHNHALSDKVQELQEAIRDRDRVIEILQHKRPDASLEGRILARMTEIEGNVSHLVR